VYDILCLSAKAFKFCAAVHRHLWSGANICLGIYDSGIETADVFGYSPLNLDHPASRAHGSSPIAIEKNDVTRVREWSTTDVDKFVAERNPSKRSEPMIFQRCPQDLGLCHTNRFCGRFELFGLGAFYSRVRFPCAARLTCETPYLETLSSLAHIGERSINPYRIDQSNLISFLRPSFPRYIPLDGGETNKNGSANRMVGRQPHRLQCRTL